MQRAIHLFPGFQNIKLIQEVRMKYDPLHGLVAPHITLVFPFETEILSSQLEQHVRKSLVGVCPFRIQLKGITATLDNYLFLNVKKGNDNIIELHDKLYSGILIDFMSRRHTFTPHLTLGKLRNDAALQTALRDTQFFETTFESLVTRVTSEIIGNNGESIIDFSVPLS